MFPVDRLYYATRASHYFGSLSGTTEAGTVWCRSGDIIRGQQRR